MSLSRRRMVWIIAVGVTLALGAMGLVYRSLLIARQAGQRALTRQDWPVARANFQYVLRWNPTDAQVRLWLAESWISDDTLRGTAHVNRAVQILEQIPENSPLSALGHFRLGQTQFVVLHHPQAAEFHLQTALKKDPVVPSGDWLLWKLYCYTSRPHLMEPHFWRAYERTPPTERPAMIRAWYFAEFSPGNAQIELDRHWGILGHQEMPTKATELKRYELFRESQPESALVIALIARWYLQQAGAKPAQEFLDLLADQPSAWEEPFYVATQVETYYKKGDFDAALTAFQRWPKHSPDYAFHQWRGIVAQEIQHDDRAAIAAFKLAIESPTGDTDWLTMHRLAHCLEKVGENDAAKSWRERSQKVEKLMSLDHQRELRKALIQSNTAAYKFTLRDFYHQLEATRRHREVEAWEEAF